MSSQTLAWKEQDHGPAWSAAALLLRPLQFGLMFPSALYVTTLAIFLFRPPELDFFYADRIAFCVLVFFVMLRTFALRERMPFVAGVSLPMLGLIALAMVRALREPFDPQNWSVVASKFIVPFVLFHLAILVFRGPTSRGHLKTFLLLTLGYLLFTAVASLLEARVFVFPRYILDESLGIHVHRARGPFLQAVANGVSLNILALLALAFWENRRKLVLLMWIVLPVAILATMTRAVWISFALSTVLLIYRLRRRHSCRAWPSIAVVGLLLLALISVANSALQSSIWSRSEERGPVDVRMAVYGAAWTMFQERPLTGWTAGSMYPELARRMPGYRLRAFYVHNTYLALLIEFGIPGLLLYMILFVNLFRATSARSPGPYRDGDPLATLRIVWPIVLGVYLLNGVFVDMVYQFVNGLLFTFAGIVCASREMAS